MILHVEEARLGEEYFRRLGEYETAVQFQMLGDALAIEARPPMCSWFQRGRVRIPATWGDGRHGLFGIACPNGFALFLTQDAAWHVWSELGEALGVTSSDLRALARAMDEQRITVDYDDDYEPPKETSCEKS